MNQLRLYIAAFMVVQIIVLAPEELVRRDSNQNMAVLSDTLASLLQDTDIFVDMFDDVEQGDEVETQIGERKGFQSAVEGVCNAALVAVLYRKGGSVGAVRFILSGELCKDCARSATDIKHLCAVWEGKAILYDVHDYFLTRREPPMRCFDFKELSIQLLFHRGSLPDFF
jgi:hypothetical protein